MIESWPTATFSINFNARQPAGLKKEAKLTRCVCVGYLSVSPPVCGPLLSFGLLNELDFYRFRLAFPLFHFLSF